MWCAEELHHAELLQAITVQISWSHVKMRQRQLSRKSSNVVMRATCGLVAISALSISLFVAPTSLSHVVPTSTMYSTWRAWRPLGSLGQSWKIAQGAILKLLRPVVALVVSIGWIYSGYIYIYRLHHMYIYIYNMASNRIRPFSHLKTVIRVDLPQHALTKNRRIDRRSPCPTQRRPWGWYSWYMDST